MRETLDSFCRRTNTTGLLEQWDFQRNFPITPNDISRGSKKKVWWRCEKGHSWQATLYTRTGSGTGCPICAGKIPVSGKTDLATRFPALALEWHPSWNGDVSPQQVLPGSHRIVWWQCANGHTWQAQIKSRVSGCGCPVCAGRTVVSGENDLGVQFPEIARQWHPSKNGDLTPAKIRPGSPRKVWWICEKGHQWKATVASRTSNGYGCPVCAGKIILPGENDLASQFPQIAEQWDFSKNDTLSPQQVAPYSNRKVWWRCQKGHSYQSSVVAHTRGSGCPYCAGKKVLPGFNDLATLNPKLAKQWHPTLNHPLTPSMVTTGSHRKVWWICSSGHVWKAIICSRAGTQKNSCPICSGRINRKKLIYYNSIMDSCIAEQLCAPSGQPEASS